MKREDDTSDDTEQSPQPKRKPDGYYYDDSTGYEIYEPTNGLEEDEPEE
ncbi:MAG TPA: hypothetical protein VGJ55_17300 [Pyrinomonadaceae bacterium]